MNKKNKILLMLPVLAVLTLTNFQCGQKNELANVAIPITNFDYQNYGCMVDYVNMQANTVYVINSAEEFAQHFNCETDPQIDFAKKTLLVAYGVVSGDVGSTNCELLKTNNKYILNVDVIMCITASAVPTNWNVAAIIDKDSIHNIMLNVNIVR